MIYNFSLVATRQSKKLLDRTFLLVFGLLFLTLNALANTDKAWIRVNQLGYAPAQIKVAVLGSKKAIKAKNFEIREADTEEIVYEGKRSPDFGAYGPFAHGFRLNFSEFQKEGTFYIQVGSLKSPEFQIKTGLYKGAADFALRYMRQQRSLFNPFLKATCHTHDGYSLYGESAGLKDSTRVDVGGGWHDASDYLQYATTSANAIYHLLMAYRDFPSVFADQKQADGLDGDNGVPDVLDEAKWGLDWLLKMHPRADWLFNQIGDDRDHAGLRLPGEDSLYGKGAERPVYFIDGKPQQRGQFHNETKGTSSTAAKFSSAFQLGAELWKDQDAEYADGLRKKAQTALDYAYKKPGVTQTVSVLSPYIYAEEDWKDDMELALALAYHQSENQEDFNAAFHYAQEEPLKEWMARDTANHYQYYPFINLGHYELGKQAGKQEKEELMSFYKQGLDAVWERAQKNAFYRGVPFIWVSNNLTVSFIIQALWYEELTGDNTYSELAQANIDWLFGVNPWGASMIYGFPKDADTPKDPHSAFTHLKDYPIDGGLVDGPVYADIFNNLIGIQLYNEDPYAEFQSDLVVYHDDFGDYSTNEPTMDGTASLVYLLAALEDSTSTISVQGMEKDNFGAVIRGNRREKNLALVFTAHDYNEGFSTVFRALQDQGVKAGFFLTGEYLKNNSSQVQKLYGSGHYIGPHSFAHLLYADWDKRKTLVSEKEFKEDLMRNVELLHEMGIQFTDKVFLPAYEWHNRDVVNWSKKLGYQVINYTPGLRTPADYTDPEMKEKYLSSEDIIKQLFKKEAAETLNGYIILVHLGTNDRRKDKLYDQLEEIIKALKEKGYSFQRIDELLRGAD